MFIVADLVSLSCAWIDEYVYQKKSYLCLYKINIKGPPLSMCSVQVFYHAVYQY